MMLAAGTVPQKAAVVAVGGVVGYEKSDWIGWPEPSRVT